MKKDTKNNTSSKDSDEVLSAINSLTQILELHPEVKKEADPFLVKIEKGYEDLVDENKMGDDLLKEANARIKSLEQSVKKVGGTPEVTINGKDYFVTSGAKVSGRKYTQDELLKDNKAKAALLQIPGQQVIVPVNAEEDGKEAS